MDKFFDWLNKDGGKDKLPLQSAKEMADEYNKDLTGRLEHIVNENDRQFVQFTIQPYAMERSSDAGLKVRIFMKVDSMKNPLGTAQQIFNAVWGQENRGAVEPSEVDTLVDTITEYYKSGGRTKNLDDSGNLTTQTKYTFSRE